MNTLSAGDRIRLRDRPWTVKTVAELEKNVQAVKLEALDGEDPFSLEVLTPPDIWDSLPPSNPSFDADGILPFGIWRSHHQALNLAGTVIGIGHAAFAGRIELESYQFAPLLRILSKPRPRLLIADDVGLGKTIEAGLIVLELMARRRADRVLVVVPAGLLLQWNQELLDRFGLDFVMIESAAGLSREQADLPAGVSAWDHLPRIITSIDYLKKITVRTRALRRPWDLVIVDEAHGLAVAGTESNPYKTQRGRLGEDLALNSTGFLLLTATPHNGFTHSFHSLLDLIEPGLASLQDDEQKNARVGRLMIRRMKSQIKRKAADGTESPLFLPREVQGIAVELSEEENAFLKKIGSYCSKTAKEARGTDHEDLVSFTMQIVKKRSLSSRLALLRTIENRLEGLKAESAEIPPERAEIRDLRSDLPLNETEAERTVRRLLRSSVPSDEKRRTEEIKRLSGLKKTLKNLPDRDPKIESLLKLIKKSLKEEPDEKFILFTEYRDTIEAIKEVLDRDKTLSGRYAVLTGGLTIRKRREIQSRFESAGINILLATDAASEGLNLQHACRRIIHFELPWNPNRLEQRNGRVDRYGQTRSPVIRWLFYPDSPEDSILHRLIEKISSMAESRVSTPEIFGVLKGGGELEETLTLLDSEDESGRIGELVTHFEDRTRDYVAKVRPFLEAAGQTREETDILMKEIGSAVRIRKDDTTIEELFRTMWGSAVIPLRSHGLFRIDVPVRFRGERVKAHYPAMTFRRSVAVTKPADEVEFVTTGHPLFSSLIAESRRLFLQVWSGERGLPPRRLAVCRNKEIEKPTAIFTFLLRTSSGGKPVEEILIGVRVNPDGTVEESGNKPLILAFSDTPPGEAGWSEIGSHFKNRFETMLKSASSEAAQLGVRHTESIAGERTNRSEALLVELESDLKARLDEIDRMEEKERGLVDERTGQQFLFASGTKSSRPFEELRTLAKIQSEKIRMSLAEYARVDDPSPPAPLGVLFVLPGDPS